MNIIENLLKEAMKAYKKDEVPIGCVIVKEGKIISRAHNTKQRKHICINHAEILAIKRASKKLKDWRLNDCELFVTLEPCKMCMEVIRQSRIRKVYFLLNSKFTNENGKKIEMIKICDEKANQKYLEKLESFFASKR